VTNPEVEKNPGEVKKPGESGKDSNTPQINQLEKTQEQKDKTPNSVSGSDVKANQKESLNGKPGALETTSSPPPKD
jgi:hypothetical protein